MVWRDNKYQIVRHLLVVVVVVVYVVVVIVVVVIIICKWPIKMPCFWSCLPNINWLCDPLCVFVCDDPPQAVDDDDTAAYNFDLSVTIAVEPTQNRDATGWNISCARMRMWIRMRMWFCSWRIFLKFVFMRFNI